MGGVVVEHVAIEFGLVASWSPFDLDLAVDFVQSGGASLASYVSIGWPRGCAKPCRVILGCITVSEYVSICTKNGIGFVHDASRWARVLGSAEVVKLVCR